MKDLEIDHRCLFLLSFRTWGSTSRLQESCFFWPLWFFFSFPLLSSPLPQTRATFPLKAATDVSPPGPLHSGILMWAMRRRIFYISLVTWQTKPSVSGWNWRRTEKKRVLVGLPPLAGFIFLFPSTKHLRFRIFISFHILSFPPISAAGPCKKYQDGPSAEHFSLLKLPTIILKVF